MSRKLASIVTIATVAPIPDAERLEVVTMEGKAWQVVVAKGEFHPGDRAVYFEIDSALPADDKRYEFLHGRCLKEWKLHGEVLNSKVRIKTVKLRGVISQGLVMPMSGFPAFSELLDGAEVTSELRVEHFDEVNERMLAVTNPAGMNPNRKGDFPSWIPKTDEERIQNLADWPEKLKGVLWEVTEKKDGTSMTVFYAPSMRPEDPFGVCSRNFELKPGCADWYGEMVKTFLLEEALKTEYKENGGEYALQGELVGPGVNGNRDALAWHEFRVFRIWDVKRQEFLSPSDRLAFCRARVIPHVPVINPAMDVFSELPTVDDILKFAEGKTANGREREGLVFKETVGGHPRSFKAVSNRCLLKGN